MLPDLSLLAWAWLALVVLGASVLRGLTGFGSAAIMVAGGSLVVPPALLVAPVVLIETALAAPMWGAIRGHVDWRRVGALFLGCLLGVPLGVRAMASLGEDAGRALVAGLVLAGALLLASGRRMTRPAGLPSHAAVGIASGIANGAAVGGLPVAAFFAAQPIAPAAFRATLVAYFLLLDLWTLPLMAREGLLGWSGAALAALGFPLSVLGMRLGSRGFDRASPEAFRRAALGALVALAALGLLRALL